MQTTTDLDDLDFTLLDPVPDTDRALVAFEITKSRDLFGYRVVTTTTVSGEALTLPSGDIVITRIIDDGGLGGEALTYLLVAIETGREYKTADKWIRWKSGRAWAQKARNLIRHGEARVVR